MLIILLKNLIFLILADKRTEVKLEDSDDEIGYINASYINVSLII